MSNLKQETLDIMKEHLLTTKDVDFVTVLSKWKPDEKQHNLLIPTAKFWAYANQEYDSGFGGNEVNLSLKVVFKNGSWLERHEYDGSEWWEYKEKIERPEKTTEAKKIWEASNE